MPLFGDVKTPPEFAGQSPTTTLVDGESYNFDARFARHTFTVICPAAVTATVDRLFDPSQTTAIAGDDQIACSADSVTATPVDWPYYRVTASGGSVVVAVI